jgi:hypothetical protein
VIPHKSSIELVFHLRVAYYKVEQFLFKNISFWSSSDFKDFALGGNLMGGGEAMLL